MFYTIQNNSILTAENEHALSRFYDNVKKLPDDYQVNKYIVENGALILNPNWEKIEIENKQKTVREVRNSYLADTDKYMLIDFPITDEMREQYKAYRQYLRNYTNNDNWFEIDPSSFDEWSQTIIELNTDEKEVMNDDGQ